MSNNVSPLCSDCTILAFPARISRSQDQARTYVVVLGLEEFGKRENRHQQNLHTEFLFHKGRTFPAKDWMLAQDKGRKGIEVSADLAPRCFFSSTGLDACSRLISFARGQTTFAWQVGHLSPALGGFTVPPKDKRAGYCGFRCTKGVDSRGSEALVFAAAAHDDHV